MDFENALGIGKKPLAAAGEPHAAAAAMKQVLAQRLLEPLYLHGHGRLGASDLYGHSAQRSRMRRAHEGRQELEVERGLHINSIDIGIRLLSILLDSRHRLF